MSDNFTFHFSIFTFHNFQFGAVYQAGLAGGDELVAFLQVAGNDGNDFNTVVETLAKGDGYAVGGAVLVGEDVTVVAAREFQHALVGYHDSVDLAQGKGGADKHAGTNLLTTIGDVELSLEGVAGGVDGGIDNLDGGREGLVGIDVAVENDLTHIGFQGSLMCHEAAPVI